MPFASKLTLMNTRSEQCDSINFGDASEDPWEGTNGGLGADLPTLRVQRK